jgi:hypothetical protein
MLSAWLLIDLRGIYLFGLCLCSLPYCNLLHPSLARAPLPIVRRCFCRCAGPHRLPVAAVRDRVPLPALCGRRRADGLDRPWGLFRWRSGCRRHPRHPNYCSCETPLQHWSSQHQRKKQCR